MFLFVSNGTSSHSISDDNSSSLSEIWFVSIKRFESESESEEEKNRSYSKNRLEYLQLMTVCVSFLLELF